MKKEYKRVMSEIRRSKRRNTRGIKLIDMLINYKTWHYDLYKREKKEQLLFLLRKQKSWTGDVRRWFSRYGFFVEQPNHQTSWWGSRYIKRTEEENEQELIEDLPF